MMKVNLFKLTTVLLLTMSLNLMSENLEGIKKENHTIKVALLLDTSNSMDGLIN